MSERKKSIAINTECYIVDIEYILNFLKIVRKEIKGIYKNKLSLKTLRVWADKREDTT